MPISIRNPKAEALAREVAERAGESMTEAILEIVKKHGRVGAAAERLTEETDLYQAGMTSHASVNVMLALEAQFEIEFPDRMLRRSVFASIGSIREAVEELKAEA